MTIPLHTPTPDSAAFTIRLNERCVAVRPGTHLAALLAEQGVAAERVASARNGVFIARGERERVELAPGDHITLFEAIVGG